MNRWLIIIGFLIVLVGLFWPYVIRGIRFVLGLPGNFVIQREGLTIYLPITLSIIISILLTLILMLLSKR